MSIGKFEGCKDEVLAEYLHKLSLEGCDNELGDVSDFNWYGLLLEVDGHGFLHLGNGHSFIICEDNYGFFTYTEYTDKDKALSAWSKLEGQYEEFMAESEGVC